MGPIKVFGIGQPKTGLVSLTKALRILGYNTVQYPSDLQILEDIDAATDLPILINYPEIDRRFPNSKFILTIRDRGDWLKSIEAHFRRHPPSTRSEPVLENRKLVYGSVNPSRDQFLVAYRKHELEVKKYFENRQDSLLIINICGGDGWKELCSYLGKSIPEMEFPRLNVSGSVDVNTEVNF